MKDQVITLLKIVVLGAYPTGLLLAALGVFLVYLDAKGDTEFSFFGQTFKSTDVGIAAIVIGAATIVLLVRKAIKTAEVRVR